MHAHKRRLQKQKMVTGRNRDKLSSEWSEEFSPFSFSKSSELMTRRKAYQARINTESWPWTHSNWKQSNLFWKVTINLSFAQINTSFSKLQAIKQELPGTCILSRIQGKALGIIRLWCRKSATHCSLGQLSKYYYYLHKAAVVWGFCLGFLIGSLVFFFSPKSDIFKTTDVTTKPAKGSFS